MQRAAGACAPLGHNAQVYTAQSGRSGRSPAICGHCRPRSAAVDYRARPMLEIISPDPDCDIVASADRLVALGLVPRHSPRRTEPAAKYPARAFAQIPHPRVDGLELVPSSCSSSQRFGRALRRNKRRISAPVRRARDSRVLTPLVGTEHWHEGTPTALVA